jgi:EAL domain-containing protein (putative c-di-GMP-specific phosphodiesterase class I)/CheY-like chemotaxis protein
LAIPMNLAQLSVLIAEDSTTQRQIWVQLMRMMGIQTIHEAADGQIALDKLRELKTSNQSPQVVLTDLDMPNMDGITLVGWVAQEKLCLSVALMSARDESILRAVQTICEEAGLQVLGALSKTGEGGHQTDLKVLAHDLQQLLAQAQSPQAPGFVPKKGQGSSLPGRLSLDDIIQGIEKEQMTLWFQPKVNPFDLKCQGAEALVRWFHPDWGMIPPDLFIPTLEKADHMFLLTRLVMKIAACELREWRRAGSRIKLSINISGRNLSEKSLIDDLESQIRSDPNGSIQPSDFILELTETSVCDDPLLALSSLSRMRLHGFELSIDDYGTGFSTMQQLGRIPFNELKIDRSLVAGADRHRTRQVVLSGAIETAKKLGLKVVVEGVETPEELELVRRLGGDLVQGYLVSKPIPGIDFRNKFL